MQYELFYLIAGSKERDVKNIQEEVKKMVSEEGAIFETKETVEKRRLAYKIKHDSFGIYTAQRFKLSDPEKIKTINRKLNLYPEVLRFIISRADDLPELLSREERIAASEQAAKREEKAVEKAEVKKAAEEPKKTKKPDTKEDIDKQLEEILNI